MRVISGVLILWDTMGYRPRPPIRGRAWLRHGNGCLGYSVGMKLIAFLVSLALFVAGLYIMGSAFYVPGFEAPLFIGGILVTSAGLALPVHVLKRVDG